MSGTTALYISIGLLVTFLSYTIGMAQWMRWAEVRASEIAERDPDEAFEMWCQVDSNKMLFPWHWVRTYWKWREK